MNAHPAMPGRPSIPGVKHMLAVASGKGGVGKSTTAVNLSVALAQEGAEVGLMDGDIYGPNVPIMMGVRERPGMSDEGKMVPPERHGVKVISLGLIAQEGAPVIWRGPMLAKMVTQFLQDVAWAPLDYLVVDLPPGTGDVPADPDADGAPGGCGDCDHPPAGGTGGCATGGTDVSHGQRAGAGGC